MNLKDEIMSWCEGREMQMPEVLTLEFADGPSKCGQ